MGFGVLPSGNVNNKRTIFRRKARKNIMGLEASTQSGVAYKIPEFPEEHQHLLNKLPQKYIQTTLVPEEELDQQKRPELYQTEMPDKPPKEYLKGDLECLKQTEHFEPGLIKHIFLGEVKSASAGKDKRRLEAIGFHSESVKNSEGKVIPGTRSTPNNQGVYQGKVTVKGIRKRTMSGISTFFPRHWSPQQVVNAINHAYENRQLISGNLYSGSSDGIKIVMRINANGKIATAFPSKENLK